MNRVVLFVLSALLHTSTERLYIDQKLACDILVEYEPTSTPNFDGFFLELQKRDLSSFSIVSQSVEKRSDTSSMLKFMLEPTRLERAIFTPGFLTIYPDKKLLLLPAFQATILSTGLSKLDFFPLLPLYPEKKIGVSAENRLRLMSPEMLERASSETLLHVMRYKYAWNMLVGVLIVFVMSVLCTWVLVQYEIARRARQWFMPKQDPFKELWRQVLDTGLDLRARWECLSLLLRGSATAPLPQSEDAFVRCALQSFDKQMALQLCRRMELVLYAESPTSEEELKEAIAFMRQIQIAGIP